MRTNFFGPGLIMERQTAQIGSADTHFTLSLGHKKYKPVMAKVVLASGHVSYVGIFHTISADRLIYVALTADGITFGSLAATVSYIFNVIALMHSR